MNWPQGRTGTPTDPGYFQDAASPREAKLRADFTRYHYLREIAPYGETPDQVAELTARAADLSSRWANSGPTEQRSLWAQLDAATAVWQTRPETARAHYFQLAHAKASGDLPVDDQTWRTLSQAAIITGRIEPGITGSGQDGARSRPQDRALGTAADPANLLDRALGGRGPDIGSLAEIDAIIAATDELLDAEERDGDLDTGADERAVARRNALRQIQDLTAEHTHTSERFTGVASHDQNLIDHLDGLLTRTRLARSAAEQAGASPEHIHTAYLAGREGTYYHDTTPSEPGSEPELAEPAAAARIDAAVTAATGEQAEDNVTAEFEPAHELDIALCHNIGAEL
ncbi:hypothetical protein IU510_21070 [Nocardia cyriacigeorgica]|uniref:hypothetical protein n=1 Tax=Nocardia cyriacigeorgica TaxID=135487 RepID=UPI001893E316|nr:hypothetical protein [Nocardia cyriacigeorgica]MBF6100553.1 hypothetical protein [Nocardia cyriacigeorgica]